MGMMQEFKEFAVKGNVIDLAVGVIIGGAFGKIVTSILAFIIFMMVKQVNRLKREAPPTPPAATPEDVVLLREIRDSLRK